MYHRKGLNKACKIFAGLFFGLIYTDLMAQVPVGDKYDINGAPFNGYYDRFDYTPKNKISVDLKSDLFEYGYYYDKNNTKVNGYIRLENNKIGYKKSRSDLKLMMFPEETSSFVLGTDSFFVVSSYYHKKRLKSKPTFVQFLTKINGVKFVQHYHFTSSMGQQYGGQPSIAKTILAKKENETVWDNFFKEKFRINVDKYLDVPDEIKRNINNGKLKESGLSSIIKAAEYFVKFRNNESIYFDKYWNEIRSSQLSNYRAVIAEKKGAYWTLDYFIDDVKVYTITYASFSPNIKVENMYCYSDNGKVRQEIRYKNNNPQEYKIYNRFGVLQTQYEHTEDKDSRSGLVWKANNYIFIGDSAGNNVLDSNKLVEYKNYDEINSTTYSRTYYNGKIMQAYRIRNDKRIYQITNPNFELKIGPLLRKWEDFTSSFKYNEALSVNAEGVILVDLVVDENGRIIESAILNKLHPELDRTVNDFVKDYLNPSGGRTHRFKPLKIDSKKECVEFVMPFEFFVNRFYRKPAQYNHYYNMHWNMFNQMNNMNNIVLPPTPRIPVGF